MSAKQVNAAGSQECSVLGLSGAELEQWSLVGEVGCCRGVPNSEVLEDLPLLWRFQVSMQVPLWYYRYAPHNKMLIDDWTHIWWQSCGSQTQPPVSHSLIFGGLWQVHCGAAKFSGPVSDCCKAFWDATLCCWATTIVLNDRIWQMYPCRQATPGYECAFVFNRSLYKT